MSHPSVNLDVYRTEAKVFTITLIDRRTRLGIDLTGSILTFTVRLLLAQVAADIQIATGPQLVHDVDQVANPGKFVLTLTTGDTTIAIGDYFWDLFRDDEMIVAPGEVPAFKLKRSARYGPA